MKSYHFGEPSARDGKLWAILRGMRGSIVHKFALAAYCMIAALLVVRAAVAQGYLTPLESNKKVVYDFYRLVYEPRNADLVEQYMAADFTEHDPRRESGRDNFIKALKSLETDSYDVGDTLRNPPALVMAQGDLVTYIFRRLVPDPQDRSKTYEHFSFDTYRVKDRKIVEHWNDASK